MPYDPKKDETSWTGWKLFFTAIAVGLLWIGFNSIANILSGGM